jgi:hypothetical protein
VGSVVGESFAMSVSGSPLWAMVAGECLIESGSRG